MLNGITAAVFNGKNSGADGGCNKTWRHRLSNWYFAAVLVVHTGLLAFGASVNSPTYDEYGHLVSGLVQWRYNAFQYYCVNPPLVRAVATLPLLNEPASLGLSPHETDDSRHRPEWIDASGFVRKTGPDIFRLFRHARWACIPFSLIGAIVCWRWSNDLYGEWAAGLGVTLWCTSPLILGHGQLITPDVGGASMGVAAAYLFWRWAREPTWLRASFAGSVLGIAELTKFTLIVFFVILPICWCLQRCIRLKQDKVGIGLLQLSLILILALYIVNLGYGFGGTGRSLGKLRFVSRTLSGNQTLEDPPSNRFNGSFMANIPVPLPEWYCQGIDVQQLDFEQQRLCYFHGTWKEGGWWYYYLLGFALKETIAFSVLFLIALILSLFGRYRLSGEVFVVVPIVVLLTLLCVKSGLSRHLRYAMPILPFAFVWASKAALLPKAVFQVFSHAGTSSFGAAIGRNLSISMLLLITSHGVFSSLSVFPQNIAYFNELVGGPKNGHLYMDSSNIDWGQDLFRVQRWVSAHDVELEGFAYMATICPRRFVGLTERQPPMMRAGVRFGPSNVGVRPGWYAVGVSKLLERDGGLTYFLRLKPVDFAGYGTHIYHITIDDANALRREYGLPPLPES